MTQHMDRGVSTYGAPCVNASVCVHADVYVSAWVYVCAHTCMCAHACVTSTCACTCEHDGGELTSGLRDEAEDVRGLGHVVVVHDGNGGLHGGEGKQILHSGFERDPDTRRQGVFRRHVPLTERVLPVTLLPELDLKIKWTKSYHWI